jgi:integrase/recombinase XerD
MVNTMNAEQQTLAFTETPPTPATLAVINTARTRVAKPSAGLARTGRHASGGKTSKVTLVEATLDHSPGQIDLGGPALAQALSDPAAPPHVRLIAGWLANFSSLHTRNAYYGDLISFATYANNHGINIIEATKSDVAGFKAVLEDTDGDNRSPATVARRISAVSSFFRHLEEEGHSIGNPALLVRRPKVSTESMTPALTRTEAARLLEHAETAGPRDHALICLLLLNGLRISEICSANIGDLHTVEHHQVLKIKRKGGLVARTVLAPRTHGAIRTHIDTRTNTDGKTARGPLIIDNTGTRIDRFQALRIVGRLTKTAGIDKPITPHGLRHTFVTTARAANIDVRDVQAAVGHADPRTTMRYDQTKQRLDAHPTYIVSTHIASGESR